MKGKKISCFLLAIFTIVTSLFSNKLSNRVFASRIESEQITIEKYADELKFYFETVGHFQKDGKYIITDYYLLKQKALSGDEFAKILILEYENRSLKSFLWCIAKDQSYGILDFLDGDKEKALITALSGGSWYAAGKILYNAMKQVGKLAGKVTSGFFTVASLAMSAYSCRDEY